MKARQQRMLLVTLVIVSVVAAVGFALRAFRDNLLYFYTPTQVMSGAPPEGRKFRLGGLVNKGSVRRSAGQLEVKFDVTDLHQTLTVVYTGVLPDLFREGQGVIAYGVMRPDGKFWADEVLAKHDENYMPPEVAQALKASARDPGAPVRMSTAKR